ncbi:hypothetical protein [Streptomyces sp. NRRL S-1813]|uniref:hypothetical protein n=1 Tax=Streptomyces sp. NRRL S-1813 TaxID=1463888 RepID=UPI0005613B01|nr:hypothetical protein [Streptomyces sp. NRRL S-1813]
MSDTTDDHLEELIDAIGLKRPSRGPGARAACGTSAGYARHRNNGEEYCDDCRAAKRTERASATPAGHRQPIDHGTRRGYRQHRYRNETPCDPCRQADLAYQRQRYAVRKGHQS